MQEIKEQNVEIWTSFEFVSYTKGEMSTKLETLEAESETER